MCYPTPLLVVAASYSSGGREERWSKAEQPWLVSLSWVLSCSRITWSEEWRIELPILLLTRMWQFSLSFMSSLWKRDFSWERERECWSTKNLRAWGGGGQTLTLGFTLLAQTAPELGRGQSGVSAILSLGSTAGETTCCVTGTLQMLSSLSLLTVKLDKTSNREPPSDLKAAMKNTRRKESREAWYQISSAINTIRRNSTTFQVREINELS